MCFSSHVHIDIIGGKNDQLKDVDVKERTREDKHLPVAIDDWWLVSKTSTYPWRIHFSLSAFTFFSSIPFEKRERENGRTGTSRRQIERQSNNCLIVIISFIIIAVAVVSSARLPSRIFHVDEPWMKEFDEEMRVTYSAGARRVSQTITSQFSSRLFCHFDWARQSKCLSFWRCTAKFFYFLRL